MRIGIIGTAGRGAAAKRLTRNAYIRMYNCLLSTIQEYHQGPYTAVSGGAAWADHLAVSLYLSEEAESLELHLPAEFSSRFIGGYKSDASTANHYHEKFSRVMGGNTLLSLRKAIDQGATCKTYNGFKARNLGTGNVDILVAFTFGEASSVCHDQDRNTPHDVAGLADGGTAHCWDNSNAKLKIHHNLNELLKE